MSRNNDGRDRKGMTENRAAAYGAAEEIMAEAASVSLDDLSIRALLEEGRLDCGVTSSGNVVARRKPHDSNRSA